MQSAVSVVQPLVRKLSMEVVFFINTVEIPLLRGKSILFAAVDKWTELINSITVDLFNWVNLELSCVICEWGNFRQVTIS